MIKMNKNRITLLIILFLISSSFLNIKLYSRRSGWTSYIRIVIPYKKYGSRYASGYIRVYLPKNYHKQRTDFPLLIALPGWAAKADDWRTRANISRYAEKYKFIVALVEMKTTTYETRYYPETNRRFKWGNMPGGLWVGKAVIPYLRKHFRVDKTGRKTAIIGLSTGARGAVYNAQLFPKYFSAVCAMSGDYDRKMLYNWIVSRGKSLLRHEPPSVYMYGNPKRNNIILNRWFSVDNPSSQKNIDILKNNSISVLLIHGGSDPVCPPIMSSEYYKLLKRNRVDVKLIIANHYKHEWRLWAKYLKQAVEFFLQKWNLIRG